MVVSALKKIVLLMPVVLLFFVATGYACFGPKLFIGVGPGLEGEMRYHLVAIYLHEKTGIDSTMITLKTGQTAIAAISAEEIDLGFSTVESSEATHVLKLEEGLNLYSGKRPFNDLQFSTAARAFAKLQKKLASNNLAEIRLSISSGTLPATAVRNFMMQNGWI